MSYDHKAYIEQFLSIHDAEVRKELDGVYLKAKAWDRVNATLRVLEEALQVTSKDEGSESASVVAHMIGDIRNEGLGIMLGFKEAPKAASEIEKMQAESFKRIKEAAETSPSYIALGRRVERLIEEYKGGGGT